jgi:hypothetical protein
MAKTSDKTKDTRSEPEGTDGEEGKAAPAKRKLSLKLIIIAIGGLVGLGAIGGSGSYFLFAGHSKAEAAATAEAPPLKSRSNCRTRPRLRRSSRSCRGSWMPFRLICANCGHPISTARPVFTG